MPNSRTGEDYLDRQYKHQLKKREKEHMKGLGSRMQSNLQKLSDKYPARDQTTRRKKDKKQGSKRLRNNQ